MFGKMHNANKLPNKCFWDTVNIELKHSLLACNFLYNLIKGFSYFLAPWHEGAEAHLDIPGIKGKQGTVFRFIRDKAIC